MEATLKWLDNPEVFRVNRLDAHSDHVAYQTEEEVIKGETSLRQLLDGKWKFHYSLKAEDRPEKFYEENFDDSTFGKIQVPGHMEMQGYGNPHYTNVAYPWDGIAALKPGEVDFEHNPVGSYVTTFDLNDGLKNKRVCISFQGVEEAMYLWLNGQFIGYSEDSFTPSEFDLTPFIREKGNRLCVEVYKRSSAAWLEDQDFFRFSGIFRSVYLYAKPETHLEDVWFQPILLENGNGTFKTRFRFSGIIDGVNVELQLSNKEGTLINEKYAIPVENENWETKEYILDQVEPWSHESPVLYDVLVSVKDKEGKIIEIIPYKIGFRRFEIKGNVLCLNGEKIFFCGVNRHEWNASTGRAIGKEDMDKALEVFKRNNINAVRTSHYPNQTYWYQLCDENGIYMIDENNLETHGSFSKFQTAGEDWLVPGSHKEWTGAVLDRAASMFERDKNHVAILFWSCGNESYGGENFREIANYFRAQDKTRLVHYESVVYCPEYADVTDVESRMYAPPKDIEEYLKKPDGKPFLSCEFEHCMGNAMGRLSEYFKLEDYPNYAGGFIWDFMDQAILHLDANGRQVLGYGGDFCDRQTDYAFSGDGITNAFGIEKPCTQEIRYWYSSKEERAKHDAINQEREAQVVMPTPAFPNGKLKLVDGLGTLGVHGESFSLLFNKGLAGGPVSMVVNGHEWFFRAPRPVYWRAPSHNDLFSGQPANSGVWEAAEKYETGLFEGFEENEKSVKITYNFSVGCLSTMKTQVIYEVFADGRMEVSMKTEGNENHPPMMAYGLRFQTTAPLEEYEWTGLSGETYPDLYRGGIFGNWKDYLHKSTHLVPQEYGNHMNTHLFTIKQGEHQLTIGKADEPFAFSVLPHTHEEMEAAEHQEELPISIRSTVSIFGAVRGVGGPDTGGVNDMPGCFVDATKDLTLKFCIYF